MFRIFLFFLLFFTLSLAFAEEKLQIKDIRYYEINNGIRVIIETTGFVEFTKGQLKNPERLFFDFKKVQLNKEIKKEFLINKHNIGKIRVGQFDPNTARIVFDLLNSEYEFKIIQLEDPSRVVIDIYSVKDNASSFIDINRENDKKLKLIKKKIVIDPGHGGKDSGAIGPNGLMEKDVVLDIALKIREIMKDNPKYEIILTRDNDTFIPLQERTEIANRNKADLFISIHANASLNPHARGIETYILNWTDDEEAIRVAARENAISVKKMKELKGEIGTMLASLEREAKRDDSVKIAGYVHNSLVNGIKFSFPRNDNGLKQALFYVLVGAQMPSCLLEVAYISNPEEERLLANEKFRMNIAQAIAEGIENYFEKSEKVRKVKYTSNFLIRADNKKSKNSKIGSKKL